MKKITDAQFIEAMDKAVKLRGEDYVYPSGVQDDMHSGAECVYTSRSGESACIIGTALNLIEPGLAPTYEEQYRDKSYRYNVAGDWSAGSVLLELGVSQRVRAAAASAQFRQDMGFSWGAALDLFKSGLP